MSSRQYPAGVIAIGKWVLWGRRVYMLPNSDSFEFNSKHAMFRPQRTLFSVLRMLSLAALLVVATSACDSTGVQEQNSDLSVTVDHTVLSNGAVKVEEISDGQYADIKGTTSIIRDEETYADFWQRLHAARDSVPERPSVDFESKVVIAIVLDEKPTGGYRVQIDEVLASEDGSQAEVQFTEVQPGDDCSTIQVLTSPYVLATAETQADDFTFSGSKETDSCDE